MQLAHTLYYVLAHIVWD